MRKYIISIIIISLLFGCKKDDNNSLDEQVMIDLNINLNLFLDFSLELDNSSSYSSRSFLKTDSEFVNVFDDELTIKFTSEPAGFQNSLTFNPSDSNASVRLPYGNYNWEIESSIVSGTAISQKLPLYGQSSSTILINEPNVNLDLVVQTDYSLVTVNSEHVSSVILKHDDDSLNLESKDGFFYGYVFSGATSFTLEVTDKEGSKITTTLDSVESCKEYKYTLNYSNVNVSSLVCLCDPFEVIERFLVPSHGLQNICDVNDLSSSLQDRLRGMWTFCNNADDMSSFSNNGTLNGPSSVQGKLGIDNSAYQFDGNDDFISLDDPFFDGSTSVSSFTFYALIKIDELKSNSAHVIFHKQGYWRTLGLSATRWSPNGKYVFRFGGSQPSPQQYIQILSNQEYQVDTWYNVVVTYDNSELKMYINGELDNSETITLSSLNWSYLASGNSTDTNHIGNALPNSGAQDHFKGIIDDLIYWDKALTENEILMLNR